VGSPAGCWVAVASSPSKSRSTRWPGCARALPTSSTR